MMRSRTISVGDTVMVNANINEGLGVAREQLAYRGRVLIVEDIVGYTYYLEGCDFGWKAEHLSKIWG